MSIVQEIRNLWAGRRDEQPAVSTPPEALYPEQGDLQRIVAPDPDQRMEGVSFSGSGNVLAVALSDTNRVYLYRRRPGSTAFDDMPYCRLQGPESGLQYPHDVAFSPADDGELLAVAQRSGSILIFRKNRTDESYGPEPVFVISGRQTRLQFSDGVAFLPPGGDYLSACNLTTNRVTFYRRRQANGEVEFETRPCFMMQKKGIRKPDGLAFSRDGRWLAVANHGHQTVSIYRRDTDAASGPEFERRPAAVIRDDSLRYPHSVAFTPRYNHLAVTCAGANYVNIYRCKTVPANNADDVSWSPRPSQQLLIGSEETFQSVNACNKMEGGPKGVAMHDGLLAVCRPETHLSLYRFEENSERLLLPE